VEQDEQANGLVDQVDDIVEPHGQAVDVVAVDRSDERAIDPAKNLVGNLIALVLEGLDLLGTREVPRRKNRLRMRRSLDAGQGEEALEVLVVTGGR
jgi:hypothetical protein